MEVTFNAPSCSMWVQDDPVLSFGICVSSPSNYDNLMPSNSAGFLIKEAFFIASKFTTQNIEASDQRLFSKMFFYGDTLGSLTISTVPRK